ncbi:MAG: DUF4230 domain-containing protein [Anaerolineae bacterium]|nr:DUF4230 domain-containing protein [Anaerolineae bacterium]
MSRETDRYAAQRRFAPLLLTIVAAGLILLALGLLYDHLTPDPAAATTTPVRTATAGAAAPWPTHPATFTPAPSSTPLPTRPPIPTATPTPTITPSPTPTLPPVNIADVREILELNVIEFEASTIVERERREWWGRDWVVLMAVGTVHIGFDLGQVEPPDLLVNGPHLTLILPRATVTAVELMPDRSRIYDSNRRWFFSEYEGLEVEAMEAARVALREAGQDNEGLLASAEKIAQATLSGFFEQLGYREVEVIFAGK